MLREQLVTQGATVGKYRIEARVAEGGMGVFWRALDTQLDRRVGLKTLHSEFVLEPQLRERFINEARALARLNHPNICVLHDFFEQNQQLYIVMEFIVGETLADLVRRKRFLERAQIVPLFRQILLALDYAHDHGVIHRDIKPSNIMITEQGMVKVMDFGIAKMVGSQLQLTRTGRRVGSVQFMSPEQIREGDVDHRSDLYSVGATLYQVCTGRIPFDATSEYEAMKAHLEQTPPSPRSLNPQVTEDLEYVITRAMAKRPEDRFQSAMEMRNALSATDLAVFADRVTTPSGEKTRVDMGRSGGAAKPRMRIRTFAFAGLGIAVVLLAAWGASSFLKQKPGAATANAPASPLAATVTTERLSAAALRYSTAMSLVPVQAELPGITGDAGVALFAQSGEVPMGLLEQLPPVGSQRPVETPTTQPAPVVKAESVASAVPPAPEKARGESGAAAAKEKSRPARLAEKPAKPVVLKQYEVSVIVKPAGSFQIDRMAWGQTGDKLDEGVHRLVAMGAGYPMVSEPFNLRGDTTIWIDLAARAANLDEGDLRVFAKTAEGAFPACRVKINGADAGGLPGLRLRLKEGTYMIEVVPVGDQRVDSLQFEGETFAGTSGRVKVRAGASSFARFFLRELR
jgi:serine/threonine-protein kinase